MDYSPLQKNKTEQTTFLMPRKVSLQFRRLKTENQTGDESKSLLFDKIKDMRQDENPKQSHSRHPRAIKGHSEVYSVHKEDVFVNSPSKNTSARINKIEFPLLRRSEDSSVRFKAQGLTKKNKNIVQVIKSCELMRNLIQNEKVGFAPFPIHNEHKRLKELSIKHIFISPQQRKSSLPPTLQESPQQQLKKLLLVRKLRQDRRSVPSKKCFFAEDLIKSHK